MSAAIQSFLLTLQANGFSPATITLYRWALSILCRFLDDPPLPSIKPADLILFWAWLRSDYQPHRTNGSTAPLAGRSLENIWTAERSFFRWCLETQRLKKRPDLAIRKPEYANREVQPYTPDEVRRMLDAAQRTRIANTTRRSPFTSPRPTAKRDTAILSLLADTGMRVSELARLIRSDFDLNTREVTIQAYGSGRKTKERTISIGRQTVLAVWNYILFREERERSPLAPQDILFLSTSGRCMNKDSIRLVISEIGAAAGVQHAGPHRFRHYYASEMAADDMTEEALLYNLGQTTGKMVHRYTHLHRRKRRSHTSPMDKLRQRE